MIPGQTQSQFFAHRGDLSQETQETHLVLGGHLLQNCLSTGLRGQALLCSLQLFSEILQGINYIFLGVGGGQHPGSFRTLSPKAEADYK